MSSVARDVIDAPPDAQVKILRVIFDDLFGSPDELNARLAQACEARLVNSCAERSPDACGQISSSSLSAKSREALLSRLCSAWKAGSNKH